MPESSSTLTVMFTDMVGSTKRFNAGGERAGEVVRQSLYALLRSALSATGGTEVKNLGDGLMITFPTVRAGVEAAVLMQRRAERHNRQDGDGIHLRVGISVGDAIPADGDWFGKAVVEARRLCDEAAGDQVLVTEMVRLLADPAGPPLTHIGEATLKGFSEPAQVYQVEWNRLSLDEQARALPRRLEIARATEFVSREQELDSLTNGIDRCQSGTLGIALLSGEPGIGKTALAAQVATAALTRGVGVLYGRSEEGIGTPYQPFVEVLRDLVAGAPSASLDQHVAAHGGQLLRLVPSLADRVASLNLPDSADPRVERYQLYAAAVDIFERAAEHTPLLVILDDLHWADGPTLELLRFMLPRLQNTPLMVLAIYRSTDLTADHPLPDLAADLHGEEHVTQLELRGFTDSDVMTLIRRRTGKGLDPAGEALARTLRQETAGNPFFIGELLHGVDEGTQSLEARQQPAGPGRSLPHGVRDVILRRVRRLGEPIRLVLETAAIAGPEFEAEVLRRALDIDADELDGRFDAAVRASLLTELPDCEGTFAFSHALVPYTLYEHVGPARRGRVHARIAEALEALCGDDPGSRVAELARHWARTGMTNDLPKAIRYSMAAGQYAVDRLAPGEGVRWYDQALRLHGRRPHPDETERCEILICLGKAQAVAGDQAYRQTLFAAYEAAREQGDLPRAIRAALANGRGVYSSPGQVDAARVRVLEHVLEWLGPRDSGERAELLARLADELAFARDAERVRALSAEALAVVRRIDEPRTLIDVVAERAIAIWSPDTLAVRQQEAEVAVRAAGRLGDPLARFHALRCRAYGSICAGKLDQAAADHAEALSLADRTANPMARWMARVIGSTIAMIQGRFADAEELAEGAFEIAQDSGEPDAEFVRYGQIGQLRYEQGRLAELYPVIAAYAEQLPSMPALIGNLALTAAEAGREDDARTALAQGSQVGFAPPDITWAGAIGPHALACARVGDEATATLLRPLLEPFAGQVAYTAVNAWLTVDHHLGAIARVQARYDAAEAHLKRAAEMAAAMRAPVWLARVHVEQARVRIAQRRPPSEWAPVLEDARDVGARVGAGGVEHDAGELLLEHGRTLTP